jgi:hypothetical protein
MRWLTKKVEKMIGGDEIWDFCWTFRMGNSMHVAHRRVNSHGRFLEVMEYMQEGGVSSLFLKVENRMGGWVVLIN